MTLYRLVKTALLKAKALIYSIQINRSVNKIRSRWWEMVFRNAAEIVIKTAIKMEIYL